MTDFNKELDLLQQYMDGWIDSFGKPMFTIDLNYLKTYTCKELIDILSQTGVMIYSECSPPAIEELTFEKWKQLRA